MALTFEEASLGVDVKNNRQVMVLNTKNLLLVGENKVLETIVNDGNRLIVLRFFVEIKEWSNSLSSLLQIHFLLTLPTTSTFENIFH